MGRILACSARGGVPALGKILPQLGCEEVNHPPSLNGREFVVFIRRWCFCFLALQSRSAGGLRRRSHGGKFEIADRNRDRGRGSISGLGIGLSRLKAGNSQKKNGEEHPRGEADSWGQ